MNLKNCCRLHRPYNENHSCPFRLVQTVLVRAAGETSAEGAEAKWDVRKMIPYLSSRHRMVNKVPFFSEAHSSFALLMQFFLTIFCYFLFPSTLFLLTDPRYDVLKCSNYITWNFLLLLLPPPPPLTLALWRNAGLCLLILELSTSHTTTQHSR